MTEDRLQQCVFVFHWNTYPEERGLLFLVHNNPKNRIHGAQLRARGMVSGVSDLIYLSPSGTPIFLELKTESGVQSVSQKKWEERISLFGYRYEIARSLEEVKKICGWN